MSTLDGHQGLDVHTGRLALVVLSSLTLLALLYVVVRFVGPFGSFEELIRNRLDREGIQAGLAQHNPVGEVADVSMTIDGNDIYVTVGARGSGQQRVLETKTFQGVSAELLKANYSLWRFDCELSTLTHHYGVKKVTVAQSRNPSQDIPKIYNLLKCA